jgi:transcriptional regulator with XRE-family HTH domain
VDESRRKELGDFLRKSRARRTPADAGLPAGPRRKTPGLRREEVAELAGIGPAWYTWLEQGRPVNVSFRTLDAIADALGLTRPEREHVFRLADVASSRLPWGSDHEGEEVPAVARALIAKIEPYPGCVYDTSYNILLCNSAYAACFPELASAAGQDRNILYYFSRLDSARLAPHENLVRTLIGRFRSNYSADIDNPGRRRLIEEAILKNDRMRQYWEEHIVNDAPDSSIDTVSTAVGDITFTSGSFVMGANPAVSMVVGVPRTDRDRALLEELVSVAEGHRPFPDPGEADPGLRQRAAT